MSDQQALNYSTHALEDLHRGGEHLPPGLLGLAEGIRRAVKFQLPNCADMLDIKDFREAHLDLLRLPFPVVALEVPWKPAEDTLIKKGDFEQTVSTRRIVLAWEVSGQYEPFPGANRDWLNRYPAGGIACAAISYIDAVQSRVPYFMAAFLPHDAPLVPTEGVVTSYAGADQLPSQLTTTQWKRSAEYHIFALAPELHEQTVHHLGADRAHTDAWLNIQDEVYALFQFCNVVNCANIGQATHAPPEKLNRKRIGAGRIPFSEYRTLVLRGAEADDQASAAWLGKAASGGRDEPRFHLRRGHIRRLPHKAVWVSATTVGNPRRGVIEKDYAVETPANVQRPRP